MPQNVNDFNHNDLLSNIDPDINDNRQSNCQYFDSTLFNNKFGNMNNMSIFHCNIRSSSHNLSHLKNYLATLNLEFSIIGISENWGTIQNIDVQNIPGYSHKYCIRTNGKKCGGVSLYVKKSISYKVRTKLAFQTNDFESLVIEFDKKTSFLARKTLLYVFSTDLLIRL